MRVLFAPDSFKGTATAADVAAALARGWRRVDPAAEILPLPMADGGEGTLAAFAAAVPGSERRSVTVLGPDDILRDAEWLWLPANDEAPGGTGVVELASTSGIELLSELRPWDAHTEGCGQAIRAALDAGVSRLIIGIGSSSSTDGGMGVLRALGARFLGEDGREVARGAAGLRELRTIDTSMLATPVETLVVTDVTNPLCGARGAAAVFGPQKGLEAADIAEADSLLASYADLLRQAVGDQRADADAPGTGAAGGVGFALLAWGARLVPGAEEVARLVGLPGLVSEVDVIVTGEGSYDGQSAEGKVPGFVSALAAAEGKPVAVVAGRITEDADSSALAAAVSLTEIAGSSAAAMSDTSRWLEAAGEDLARHFLPAK